MLKVAMIGLGWWGKMMVTVIQGRSQSLRVVRAVEPQIESAMEFAMQHGIALSVDYGDALSDPMVDAVILATPHSLHEAQIEAAVKAGKHIFCEKPLALTRAGAEKAVALCSKAGLVLGMGHERRFEPPVAEMLVAAAQGRLGRLLQIEANFSHDKFLSLDASNWRLQPQEAPAAGMTATGIHLTDLAVKLMGPAREVLVTCEQLGSQLPSGDTMSALCRFKNGGTAYVTATLATPFFSRFAVFGTKGWIDIRDKAHVEAPDGWTVSTGYAGESIKTADVPKAEPVKANLEAFAHAIESGTPYPVSGEDMVNNIALLESIIRGARTGQLETV